MKTLILVSAACALTICGGLRGADTAAKPAPPVEVNFVHPEKFTDVKDSYVSEDNVRDELLNELKQHIQSHIKDYLPAGWHLVVNVTNVDMAGEFEPWRGPEFDDIRIVKDVYPPRINLNFKLTDAAGKVVKQGERHLTNLSFLDEINVYPPEDHLRYEKALLDSWFRNEFGELKTEHRAG